MGFGDEYICFITDVPPAYLFFPKFGSEVEEFSARSEGAHAEPAYAVFAGRPDSELRLLGLLYRQGDDVLAGLHGRWSDDLVLEVVSLKNDGYHIEFSATIDTENPLDQQSASGFFAYSDDRGPHQIVFEDRPWDRSALGSQPDQLLSEILGGGERYSDITVAAAFGSGKKDENGEQKTLSLLAPLESVSNNILFDVGFSLRDGESEVISAGIFDRHMTRPYCAMPLISLRIAESAEDIAEALRSIHFYHQSNIRVRAGARSTPDALARGKPSYTHPYGDTAERIAPISTIIADFRKHIVEILILYASDEVTWQDDVIGDSILDEFFRHSLLSEEKLLVKNLVSQNEISDIGLASLFTKSAYELDDWEIEQLFDGMRESLITQLIIFLSLNNKDEYRELVENLVKKLLNTTKNTDRLVLILTSIRIAPLDFLGFAVAGDGLGASAELRAYVDGSDNSNQRRFRHNFQVKAMIVAHDEQESRNEKGFSERIETYLKRYGGLHQAGVWDTALDKHFPKFTGKLPAIGNSFANFIILLVLGSSKRVVSDFSPSNKRRPWSYLDTDPVLNPEEKDPNWAHTKKGDGLEIILDAYATGAREARVDWLTNANIPRLRRAAICVTIARAFSNAENMGSGNENAAKLPDRYGRVINWLVSRGVSPLMLLAPLTDIESLMSQE